MRLVKVKGHATEEHVRQGLATDLQRAGNDAVDKLAKAGVAKHKDIGQYVRQYNDKVLCLRKHLKAAVAIVKAREERIKIRKDTTPGHGEEEGDEDPQGEEEGERRVKKPWEEEPEAPVPF